MSDYNKFTDPELLNLLKQSDHVAFGVIHKRYYPLLYVHAMKRLPHRDEVKDVLQELFAFLWTNRETIYFTSGLAAYLYTSVRNRVINVFAKDKVRYEYAQSFQNFIDAGEYSTDELIREKELAALIEKEIALLPEQMRKVFLLSRFEYLSHNEIGELMGTSPLTVRKQVQNAIKILRQKLGSTTISIFL